MNRSNHTAAILRELRELLAHNEAYLGQSVESRVITHRMTHQEPCGRDWIEGEAFAIHTENEWLRRMLKDYSPLKGQIKALETLES